MVNVIQFEGSIEVILKSWGSRKFKKDMLKLFGKDTNVKARIEGINKHDDRSYG